MIKNAQQELRQEQFSHLPARDLIRNGIETERLEVIPIHQILTEAALIDDAHAQELGFSMQQKRGQLTPITVRARIAHDNGVVYDVIDGFHRTEGKRRNGDETINATVVYGCSDEEMYDLRILAASSVKSVQFSRIAQWITSSYATTPWADKGISILQALTIAHSDSNGRHVGISVDEASELKTWLRAKCKKWDKPLGSVRIEMQLVENANPDLVKEVRTVKGGSEAETTLTQIKLASVVKEFPGIDNYDIQHAILHYAIRHRLKLPQIQGITASLKGKAKPGMTEQDLEEIVRVAHEALPKLPESMKKSKKKSKKPSLQENSSSTLPVSDIKTEAAKVEPTDAELAELENEIDETELPNEVVVFSSTSDEDDSGVNNVANLGALQKQVRELEAKLEIALSLGAAPSQFEPWWGKATYKLTPVEKACLERGFYGNEELEDIAHSLRIPVAKIFSHIRSAFAKKDLVESQTSNNMK